MVVVEAKAILPVAANEYWNFRLSKEWFALECELMKNKSKDILEKKLDSQGRITYMRSSTKPSLKDVPDWLLKMGPEGGIEFIDTVNFDPDKLCLKLQTTPSIFSDSCEISSTTTIIPIDDKSCEQRVKASVVVNNWIAGSIIEGIVASGIKGNYVKLPKMVAEFVTRNPNHPDLNINIKKNAVSPTPTTTLPESDGSAKIKEEFQRSLPINTPKRLKSIDLQTLSTPDSLDEFHDANDTFTDHVTEEQYARRKSNLLRKSSHASTSSHVEIEPHVDTSHTAFLSSLGISTAAAPLFGIFSPGPSEETLSIMSSSTGSIGAASRSDSLCSSNSNSNKRRSSDMSDSISISSITMDNYSSYSIPSIIGSFWGSSSTTLSKSPSPSLSKLNLQSVNEPGSRKVSNDHSAFLSAFGGELGYENEGDYHDSFEEYIPLNDHDKERKLSLYQRKLLVGHFNPVHVIDCKDSFGKVLTHSMCTNIHTWTALFEREKFEEIRCGNLSLALV